MKRFCLCLIVIILFTSCVSLFSIPKEKEYSVLPSESTEYGINIYSVDVKKDTISDNDLIAQVTDISTAMFADLINKETENFLNLQIELKQRSYYKGISQKNSIYLVYSLTDKNEKVVFNNSYSLVCSDSIESSTIEYKLIEHMNKKIRAYFNKCGKIIIK